MTAPSFFRSLIDTGKTVVTRFIANGSLSRGAAISFYSVTSLAPVLLIVTAVAGLAFGRDDVRESLVREVGDIAGQGGGDLVRAMMENASDPRASVGATILGLVIVLITASGVFGEIQTALNTTWKVATPSQAWFSLLRSRIVGLGLVATLGFLLVVSLAASAALTALSNRYGTYLAGMPLLLSALNILVSLALFSLLFGAIYRTLPDTPIAWRDVATGAVLTAILFTLGKSLIGWYLGAAAPGSVYGAAGAPILIMLWIYYSAQILLLGAEITKAVADRRQLAAGGKPDGLQKLFPR